MSKHYASLFATFVTLVLVSTSAHADDAANPYARDIKILAKWFEGEFDNSEQLWFQNDSRSSTPEDQKHVRIHTHHMRLDKPEFGQHVFYVEEYIDNDPTNIIRQRFVTFTTDFDENAIRMQQGFFKDAESVVGGKNLDELTKDDVFFLDICDVYWQRNAGQFEGAMKEKSCVFGEGEKRRYSVHNLTLSEDKYWRVDTTFLVSDDSLHKGEPIDRPFKMNRARRFECGIIFRAPDTEPQEVEGLSIHSEGGMVDAKRNSDGQEFSLLLRKKEYPYYENRPDFLYFSLRKKGEDRSVAFTVNDIDARRIGVNFDGMIAYCHREGYLFRESLEELNNQITH